MSFPGELNIVDIRIVILKLALIFSCLTPSIESYFVTDGVGSNSYQALGLPTKISDRIQPALEVNDYRSVYLTPSERDEVQHFGQQYPSLAYMLDLGAQGLEPIKESQVSSNAAQSLIDYLSEQLQIDKAGGADGYGYGDGPDEIQKTLVEFNNNLRTPSIEDTISGPVNNPFDFEISIDNDLSNNELPHSNNRSSILDDLITSNLSESELKQLQQEQQQIQQRDSKLFENEINTNINKLKNTALADIDKSITTSDANENTGSTTPATRYGGSEYIDHPLAIIGHQYMQGGAGEGRQLLGPDGTFENVQVIKTDHAVPSYCDPPNPCPIGYTAEDGCLENFINSAGFSREYQAKQQCSCDNEHSLFNCGSPVSAIKNQIYSKIQAANNRVDGDLNLSGGVEQTSTATDFNENDDLNLDSLNSILKNEIAYEVEKQKAGEMENKLNTLARTIQNRFGNLESVRNIIAKQHENEMENDQEQLKMLEQHKSVVKKAHKIESSNFRY